MPRPKKQFDIEQYEKETDPVEPVHVKEEVEKTIEVENDPCVGCPFKNKKSQRFCGSCIKYK